MHIEKDYHKKSFDRKRAGAKEIESIQEIAELYQKNYGRGIKKGFLYLSRKYGYLGEAHQALRLIHDHRRNQRKATSTLLTQYLEDQADNFTDTTLGSMFLPATYLTEPITLN